MMDSDAIAQKHASIIQPLTRWGKPLLAGTILLGADRLSGPSSPLPGSSLTGLGRTGMGHPISWAFYLVNFVFFIGISHAGALVSAVLRITHARWGTPFGRAAEAVTVFALAAGPTNILFDLGRSYPLLLGGLSMPSSSPPSSGISPAS